MRILFGKIDKKGYACRECQLVSSPRIISILLCFGSKTSIQYLVTKDIILRVSCKFGLFKKLVEVLKNNNGNSLFIINNILFIIHIVAVYLEKYQRCSRLFDDIICLLEFYKKKKCIFNNLNKNNNLFKLFLKLILSKKLEN